MAVTYNSSIVTSGLVLCLDAANPKSYDQYENLRRYSQEFDDAAWTKTNAGITTNATISPDGTATAEALIENTTSSVGHTVSQSITYVTDNFYTASCYFKSYPGPITRNVRLQLGSASVFGTDTYININLQTGTITNSIGSPSSTSITNVGNGWYRASITKQYTGLGVTSSPSITIISTTGTSLYTDADGLSGIYLWGAQVEKGSSVTDYYATTSLPKTRGITWSNLTGTSNATISGSNVWNSTYGGQFDFGDVGQTTQYITLPHSVAQFTGSSYTMEFWMRPNTSSDIKYFCSMAASNANTNYFVLQQNISNIRLDTATTGSIPITNGEILQFCVVRDGSDTGLLYKNAGTPVTSDGIGLINGVANGGWILNQEQDTVGGGFDANQNYRGAFFIVRLYNRALTAFEIQQNFNATRSRFGI